MKRLFFSLAAALFITINVSAQSVAFINTDDVLASIPEYVAAQDALAALSDKYKASIELEVGKIETLYQNYQRDKDMMTSSQRLAAENEIITKERAVKEKQKLYFGEDGILVKKSEDILGPIRAKVDKVIETVVEEMGGIEIVVDLSVNQDIVYYKSEREITQKVIEYYKKLNN